MIDVIAVAAAQYIVLQTVDGRTIRVNPTQIVSTSEVKGKLITDKAQCIIYTTDSRFFSVVETCERIKTSIEALGVR